MVFNFFLDFPHPCNNIGDGPEGPEVRNFDDYVSGKVGDKLTIIHNIFDEECDIKLDHEYKVNYVSSYGKKMFISLHSLHNVVVNKDDNNNNKDINIDKYLLVFSFSMMGKWEILEEYSDFPLHTALCFNSNKYDFHFIANMKWKFKANCEIYKNTSWKKD